MKPDTEAVLTMASRPARSIRGMARSQMRVFQLRAGGFRGTRSLR
jgi:hypothetical protein